MQKLIFTIIFILVASAPCYAALSAVTFMESLGVNAMQYQQRLAAVANIGSTFSNVLYTAPTGNVQTGWLVSNGVEILRPLGTVSTAELSAPMVKLAGTAGAKTLLRKGLGLLGPVATAVTVGMAVKDIYDLARADKASYPLLEAATWDAGLGTLYPTLGVNVPVDHYYNHNGGTYWIISESNESDNNGDPNDCNDGGCYGGASGQVFGAPMNWIAMGIIAGNANGTYHSWQKLYFDPTHVNNDPPPAKTDTTLQDFENYKLQNGISDPIVNATFQPELDKMIQKNINTDKTQMYPTADNVKNLKNDVAVTQAPTATATAVQTAQSNYNADPTAANKQILDSIKALQAQETAAAAKEDNLTAPGVPSNTYDSLITPPEKKLIPSLLTTFINSSPLVSMVHSFVMTASGTGIVPIGLVYGQNMEFNFTRWESTFRTCGGLLLVIMHGFAVFVVVRGW